MMECVWKLTTNWASCATAQRDTVDPIVKVRKETMVSTIHLFIVLFFG